MGERNGVVCSGCCRDVERHVGVGAEAVVDGLLVGVEQGAVDDAEESVAGRHMQTRGRVRDGVRLDLQPGRPPVGEESPAMEVIRGAGRSSDGESVPRPRVVALSFAEPRAR